MSSVSEYRLPFETPIYDLESRLAEMETLYANQKAGSEAATHSADSIRRMRRELANLKRTIFANLDPWQTVRVSRHQNRPQSRDYLELVFDRFVELHGDRAIGDDQAIVTGFAHLGDDKVMFVGHQKGRSLAERTACNFGCAHPEGYRKAILKMKMAAKFRLPIIAFIDTPGAYPGIAAEERGQALAIAEALMAMSRIDTPIICLVIGEGGSGGALGIGLGDRVAMLEHSYYSVISPEGCATILWKGAEHAPRAAEAPEVHRQGSAPFRNHRRRHPRAAGGSPSRPPECGFGGQVVPDPLPPRTGRASSRGSAPAALREIPEDRDLRGRRGRSQRSRAEPSLTGPLPGRGCLFFGNRKNTFVCQGWDLAPILPG